jgi:hypothetical protein
MERKYKKKRKVGRLDNTSYPFYVYCLYYSDSVQDTSYDENRVFYIGKAKNKHYSCLRRENKHMEDAYSKTHYHFHKSRKIRQLEENSKFIMSKILDECQTESDSYEKEFKWFMYFKNKGIELTNMIECGIGWVGSGENHPSYDKELREKSSEIVDMYINKFWPIQKISRFFKKSSKIITTILSEQNVMLRNKHIRSSLWTEKLKIIEKYNEGLSLNKLSQHYNCSMNHIREILSSEGIVIKNNKLTKRSSAWNNKEEIITLFKNKKTKKEICSLYKCDISTLNSILKSYE